MKKKLLFYTFILTTLLLTGCSRQNTQMPDNASAAEPSSPSATAETTQATEPPQLNTVQNNDNGVATISEEEARQIALDQVPGATTQDIREFKTDYDNGKLQYEGKIYYDQKEYEFEIDGYSGAILTWDVESIYD